MKLNTTVVLAASLYTTFAFAQHTYNFNLSGNVTDIFSGYNPGCHLVNNECDPASQILPWRGTLSVGLLSGSDGTYNNSGIGAVVFSTNFIAFGTGEINSEPGFLYLYSATVFDGQMTSLEGVFFADVGFPGSESVGFGPGLTASYSASGFHHADKYSGSANLVAAIPEPGTYLLMLVGLVGLSSSAFKRMPTRTRHTDRAAIP